MAKNPGFPLPRSLSFIEASKDAERSPATATPSASNSGSNNPQPPYSSAPRTIPLPLKRGLSRAGTSKKGLQVAEIYNSPFSQYNAFLEHTYNPEIEHDTDPSKRQLISFYINSSSIGRAWDRLDATLNLILASLYIYESFYVTNSNHTLPYNLLLLNGFLSTLMFIVFLPRYYLTADVSAFVLSMNSITNLIASLTPLAVLLNIWFDESIFYESLLSSGNWIFLYPFIFLRLQYSLSRVLESVKTLFKITPVIKKALQSISTVVTTILAVTVLAHIVIYFQRQSRNEEVRDFGDILFFTAVSSVTGLDSDVSPDTLFTRSVVIVIMFLGIVWLPPRISEILDMIKERDPWDTSFKESPTTPHVLVIGNLSFSCLFEFLREFFCEDHGPQIVNTTVVLMSESPPDSNVTMLINDPAYKENVKFVQGSPTSRDDLLSVSAHHAKSIFILSSILRSTSADQEIEDSKKIMVTLAIKRFLHTLNKNVPIYVQILQPESSLHLELMTKNVICVDELRLGLLAKNCTTPGFSSLISGLLTSIPDDTINQLQRSVKNFNRPSYLEEYIAGLGNEIYTTSFSPIFKGMKFNKAVQYLYTNFNSILFALRITPYNKDGTRALSSESEVVITPFEYVLDGTELGYIISSDSYIPLSIKSIPTNSFNSGSEVDSTESSTLLPSNSNSGSKSNNFAENIFKSRFAESVMDSLVIENQDYAPSTKPSEAPPKNISSLDSQSEDISSTNTEDAPKVGNLIDMSLDEDSRSSGLVPSSVERNLTLGSEAFGELSNIQIIEESNNTSQINRNSDSENGEHTSNPTTQNNTKHKSLILEYSSNIPDSKDAKESNGADSNSAETDTAPISDKNNKKSKSSLKSDVSSSKKTEPSKKKDHLVFSNKDFVNQFENDLPKDLKDHVVICSTGSTFPPNMEYLIGSIRTSKREELSDLTHRDSKDETKDGSKANAGRSQSSTPHPNSTNMFDNYIAYLKKGKKPGSNQKNQPEADSPSADTESEENPYWNKQPIVMLTLEDPPETTKPILDSFGFIYYVKGTPIVKSDLARCNITSASSVIILQNPIEDAGTSSGGVTLSEKTDIFVASSDSPALVAALNVELLTHNSNNVFLTVELNYRENMQFIGNSSELLVNESYIQSFLRPCFMSGNCYTPIMLNTLICNAYYNDGFIEIIQKIIFPCGDITHQIEYSKLAASGFPLSQLPPIPSLPTPHTESSLSEFSDSHAFLVPIPKSFVGTTFSSLFLHLVYKYSAIAIGLFRDSACVMYNKHLQGLQASNNLNSSQRPDNISAAAASSLTLDDFQDQSTYYFVSNPASSTVLVNTDRVYILASKHPSF
ncbi:hypothetical protein BB560_003035 [Smittium megazygosporum]|uniref:RCK N-terminal domain-containing protein n=1 Tax=Smittium megazygosporum TaxID=133381 RepID=A0A2T9ZD84_9FUNG|nr:hypothetical protein BB560_003035 [Smittium megazygosporum]